MSHRFGGSATSTDSQIMMASNAAAVNFLIICLNILALKAPQADGFFFSSSSDKGCKHVFHKMQYFYTKDGKNAWIKSKDKLKWDSGTAHIYYECRGQGDNPEVVPTKCKFPKNSIFDTSPILCPGTYILKTTGIFFKDHRVFICYKEEREGKLKLRVAEEKEHDRGGDELDKDLKQKYHGVVQAEEDVAKHCENRHKHHDSEAYSEQSNVSDS